MKAIELNQRLHQFPYSQVIVDSSMTKLLFSADRMCADDPDRLQAITGFREVVQAAVSKTLKLGLVGPNYKAAVSVNDLIMATDDLNPELELFDEDLVLDTMVQIREVLGSHGEDSAFMEPLIEILQPDNPYGTDLDAAY